MKRILLGAALMAALTVALVPLPAQARTSVGFSLRIGDPWGGPYFGFHSAPPCILVPRTRVYVVRDYDWDLYRYGSSWYYYDDDCWYRAHSYRGPFVRVRYVSVPHQVRYVFRDGGYRTYRAHSRWGYRDRHPSYGRDWHRERVVVRDRWHRDRRW